MLKFLHFQLPFSWSLKINDHDDSAVVRLKDTTKEFYRKKT